MTTIGRWNDEEAMLSRGLAGATGIAAGYALGEGEIPWALGFGGHALMRFLQARQEDQRAADHRLKGRAVEDLIQRAYLAKALSSKTPDRGLADLWQHHQVAPGDDLWNP